MIILLNAELCYTGARGVLLGGKNDDNFCFQCDVSPAQYATYHNENNTNKRHRNYGEEILRYTCHEFNSNDHKHQCNKCQNFQVLIDLGGISETSYNPGDKIISDRNELGWEISRGGNINNDTYAQLWHMKKLGIGDEGY